MGLSVAFSVLPDPSLAGNFRQKDSSCRAVVPKCHDSNDNPGKLLPSTCSDNIRKDICPKVFDKADPAIVRYQ